MSLIYLAMNENLTAEQFANILDIKAKNSEKLMKIFEEAYNKLESNKSKSEYLSQCLPILMMSIF